MNDATAITANTTINPMRRLLVPYFEGAWNGAVHNEVDIGLDVSRAKVDGIRLVCDRLAPSERKFESVGARWHEERVAAERIRTRGKAFSRV